MYFGGAFFFFFLENYFVWFWRVFYFYITYFTNLMIIEMLISFGYLVLFWFCDTKL